MLEDVITPLLMTVAKADDGTVSFDIADFLVPEEGRLLLKAGLVAPDGRLLASAADVIFEISVDFTMDHIEVVQVIQTADNAIPLIANKTTMIRPFTKIAAGPDQMRGVQVNVHAFRGGAEIANSPWRRTNVSRSITSKEPSRDFISHAHNLTLPAHWTEEGELTLRVVVNPIRTIPEADFSNNEMEVTVRFVKGTPFSIRYLPVCIEIPGLKELCPSRRVASVAGLVPKLFPIAERDFTYRGLNIPDAKLDELLFDADDPKKTGAKKARFKSWLNRTYQLAVSQFGSFDQLIAWLPRGVGGGTLGGFSDPTWNGGQGRVTVGFDNSEGREVSDLPSAIALTKFILAHEMSHNLGLRHPATSDSCGSKDSKTDWPYSGHTIHEYGYDPNGGRLKRPRTHYDLMSYCSPHDVWIGGWMSDFHYKKLIAGMLQPQPLNEGPEEDEPGKQTSPVKQGGPVNVLMVSGAVDRDLNTGRIEEVYQFASGAPLVPTNPAGNTCLRFSGDAGAISDYCFELSFRTSETDESFAEDSFTVVTPLDGETTRITLLFNGQELASRSASAAPPAVQITSPNAGDAWDAAADGTVTWTGSDTDGDSLLYSLLYSSDNGTTWLPIVIDLTEPTHTFSPALIQGGDEVHFRVIASDGFHSSEAQAGPITVNQRPEISPEQDPVDIGQAVLGDQVSGQVVLQNPGTGPLEVASVATDQPEFRVVFPQGPFTIRAGASFSLEVSYEPSAEQSQSATLLVASNATDQPRLAIRLNGEGVDGQSPILQLDSTVVDFGAVEIGETRNANLVGRNGSHVDLAVSWSIQGGGFGLGDPATAATVPAGEEFSVPLVFTGAEAGDALGRLTLTSDDPDKPTTEVPLLAFTLPPPGAGATPGGPRINAGGVVDAASFVALVAPGGISSIFGIDLAAGVVLAKGVPLPAELGGVQVLVNGIPAPLFFVSRLQINFQIPFETPIGQTVEIVVVRNGVRGPPVQVTVAQYAPGIFMNPNTGEPIIQRHPDGALITARNPAEPGDVLLVYMAGIGGLSNPPPSGAAALGSPLATALLTPVVTVGGVPATVFFAGLTPFFVGLGQVNIQLASNFALTSEAKLQGASTLPLVVRFGDNASQTVNLPVEGAGPSLVDVGVRLNDVQPRSLTRGSRIGVNLTVLNPSGYQGPAFLSAYLSADAVIDPGGDPLLGQVNLDLDGLDQTLQQSFTIPADEAPGSYFVGLTVAASGDTNPANDTSNTIGIEVSAGTPAIDVGVQLDQVIPAQVVQQDRLTLRYTVLNPSGVAGAASRGLYLSTDANISLAEDTLINTRTLELEGGGGDENFVSRGNPLPDNLAPGAYFVGLIVSIEGDGNPANDISNALPLEVLAERPAFDIAAQIQSVDPVTVGAGDTITVEYTAAGQNQVSGTFDRSVYLSTDATITAADTLLNTRTVDIVDGNAEVVSGGNIILRVTAPGAYFVGVIVQTEGDTNPADNVSAGLPITVGTQRAPFNIGVTTDSVSPTSVAAGGAISVTYSASNPRGVTGEYFRDVYISTDATITQQDTLINRRPLRLQGGSPQITSANNVLPQTLPTGNYFVGVILESEGDSDPSDNASNGVALTITAAQALAPDRLTEPKRLVEAPANQTGIRHEDTPQRDSSPTDLNR